MADDSSSPSPVLYQQQQKIVASTKLNNATNGISQRFETRQETKKRVLLALISSLLK